MKRKQNFRKLIFLCCTATILLFVLLYSSFENKNSTLTLNIESKSEAELKPSSSLEYREELGEKGVVGAKPKGMGPLPEEYSVAIDFLGEGKVEEASRIYRNLIQESPYLFGPYLGLSACYLRSSDYEDAKTYAMKAIELNPKSVGAFINLGSSYRGLKDQKLARRTYYDALDIQDDPDAHWGLVRAYASIGDKKNAQIHLDHFKRLAPNSKYIPGLEQEVRNIK